tara:strand:+ start:226 stop:585 length:360 start_codon:yes stop_codon:yes gene_type:complete
MLQVNLYKKDALSSEDFFLREKKLLLHLVDKRRESVKFKVYARQDDYGNYLIKCRGVYKGGHIATYKLPRSIGPLDELYSVVANRLLTTIAGVYQRDKDIIASLPRFKKHRILTSERYY